MTLIFHHERKLLLLPRRLECVFTSCMSSVCLILKQNGAHTASLYILIVRVQIKERAMGKICSMDDVHDEFID